MGELLAAFGGFLAALLAFNLIARWAGTLYVEVIAQPPESRRAQTIIPVLFLHSGPWVIGILIFGGVKLFSLPEAFWRPWFVSGFALGFGVMCTVLLVALKKLQTRRAGTT